jgi:NAD(P)-dependent dehydrogenase (short-subunit alcohol dehydrogenase family)
MARYGLEGKVALPTGTTKGIGQATAVRLAKEGALVGVNYRATGDPGTTIAMIEEIGGNAFPGEADIRKPEQVIAMVDTVSRKGGRLDFLVSNAAINPLLQWEACFQVLSHTRERRARISGFSGSQVLYRTHAVGTDRGTRRSRQRYRLPVERRSELHQ